MNPFAKWAWAIANFSGDKSPGRSGTMAARLAAWLLEGTEPHPARTKTPMAPIKPLNQSRCSIGYNTPAGLLLPGTLLMAMGAQFLAPFMFVDLRFSPFL